MGLVCNVLFSWRIYNKTHYRSIIYKSQFPLQIRSIKLKTLISLNYKSSEQFHKFEPSTQNENHVKIQNNTMNQIGREGITRGEAQRRGRTTRRRRGRTRSRRRRRRRRRRRIHRAISSVTTESGRVSTTRVNQGRRSHMWANMSYIYNQKKKKQKAVRERVGSCLNQSKVSNIDAIMFVIIFIFFYAKPILSFTLCLSAQCPLFSSLLFFSLHTNINNNNNNKESCGCK